MVCEFRMLLDGTEALHDGDDDEKEEGNRARRVGLDK